jgi:hypothetical protein
MKAEGAILRRQLASLMEKQTFDQCFHCHYSIPEMLSGGNRSHHHPASFSGYMSSCFEKVLHFGKTLAKAIAMYLIETYQMNG